MFKTSLTLVYFAKITNFVKHYYFLVRDVKHSIYLVQDVWLFVCSILCETLLLLCSRSFYTIIISLSKNIVKHYHCLVQKDEVNKLSLIFLVQDIVKHYHFLVQKVCKDVSMDIWGVQWTSKVICLRCTLLFITCPVYSSDTWELSSKSHRKDLVWPGIELMTPGLTTV